MTRSIKWNALNYLAKMPCWSYFNRPTNLAFHDLTTTKTPPSNLRSLLGLSLKFIPTRRFNVTWQTFQATTFQRLNRDFKIKAFIGCPDPDQDTTDDYNPRLYVRSNFDPPEHKFPFPKALPRRIQLFTAGVRNLVRPRRTPSNLLPHQLRALRSLREQDEFLVIQCDKNLGPAIIEKEQYIRLVVRDHLSDRGTYRRLTPQSATLYEQRIRNQLTSWTKKWKKVTTKNEKRFLKHYYDRNESPFATFYATAKVHKSPLKTRPIVSCSGSLLEAIGTWVDDKLQHAARRQTSYFKSSFDLQKELIALEVPPGARLFTADAVSMYTNIPTHRALMFIGRYLRKEKFPEIPTEALMEALRLVMTHNVFTFGDTTWLQTTGTAMGTPPAPPWATLYYALCEQRFLPTYRDNLFLYRRFIDDVLGIWLPATVDDAASWTSFQQAMNDPAYALTWEVSPRSTTVDFMDLTISIEGSRIVTTLYEKPSNLHLYIPPKSCHPPGLLSGVVYGMIHRFHSLCSNSDDIRRRTGDFYLALRRRGYEPTTLDPLFRSAIQRYRTPSSTTEEKTFPMFFHVQYHPHNPMSSDIQRLWRNHVQAPPYSQNLADIRNWKGTRLGLNRLIIAHSRPPNLGNLLSYRKLKDTGPPVSSFLD